MTAGHRLVVFTQASSEGGSSPTPPGHIPIPSDRIWMESLPSRRGGIRHAVERVRDRGADLALVISKDRRIAWRLASRLPVPAWLLSPSDDPLLPWGRFRRVLAPVGEHPSLDRVLWAASLLRKTGGYELTLVHRIGRVVSFLPSGVAGVPQQVELLSTGPDPGVVHRIEELRREGQPIHLVSFEGDLVPGILELVRDLRPDAVLVPFSRRPWWQRSLAGSVAGWVVQGCYGPVQTLPIGTIARAS